MGAEQDRRHEQGEAPQGLEAALAQHWCQGGQPIVVAQGVPGAMPIEARQLAQHYLIETRGKVPRGAMPGVAPGQQGQRRGGHRVERDGDSVPESGFQQGAAVILGDLRHQITNGPIVLEGVRRQAKGEHPAVVQVQPQEGARVARGKPLATHP